MQLDEDKLNAEAKRRAEEKEVQVKQSIMSQVQQMTGAIGEAVSEAVSSVGYQIAYFKEEIANEIKFFVNQNVNRISRIDKVELIEQFEKTASQKIKRYVYSFKKVVSKRT